MIRWLLLLFLPLSLVVMVVMLLMLSTLMRFPKGRES